jgi:hypothetical protein
MASSTVPNVVFIVGDNVGWGDRNVTPGEEFTGYS